MALDELLSVPVRFGRTPHNVFAQRRTEKRCSERPHLTIGPLVGNPLALRAAHPSRISSGRARVDRFGSDRSRLKDCGAKGLVTKDIGWVKRSGKPNKSLSLTAQAAFNCCECLIGAGFAGQVTVKLKQSLAVVWCFMKRISFDCCTARAAAQLRR
jgi:hypothetical protein